MPVDKYGIVDLVPGTMRLKGIVEKPGIEESPSQLADFGRMILDQNIVDVLAKTPPGKGEEIWIVDAIRDYIKAGGKFYAKKIEDGEWLTTGDPLNYLKTTLKYAVDRKDIGKELVNFINTKLDI